MVGSKQVLALVSQENKQRKTKHGSKLNLEKPNQVRTSPFSSSAAKPGWEIGFSPNKTGEGEVATLVK